MCGIAGIHRRNNAKAPGDLARMSKELLRCIENRGHDATGVLCTFDAGDWWLRKETVTAKKFVKKGRTYATEARTALLHTRFATKGSPYSKANAHPILDASEKVAVVHNGVLWNDDEVFDAFDLKRVAETDTEAIPALISHVGWENAGDALALIDGSMAIAATHRDYPGELILAKSEGSPLFYTVTRNLVVWASSEHAIVSGFKVAGLKPPTRDKIREMPMMHMVKINGNEVGDETRFAEDPPVYYLSKSWYGTAWWDAEDEEDALDKWLREKEQENYRTTYHTPPALPQKTGRNRLDDEVLPAQNSVYEDIAIDVLIAQGWTTEDAINEISMKGCSAAGLTLGELEMVDSDIDWDSERDDDDIEVVWYGDVPYLVDPESGEVTLGSLVTPNISLVGDVALASLDRKKRAKAGLDA